MSIAVHAAPIATATPLGGAVPGSMKDAKPAPFAEASPANAHGLAPAVRPGRVAGGGLKRERGGGRPRCSSDVADGRRRHEFGIDAGTRRVFENGVETEAD